MTAPDEPPASEAGLASLITGGYRVSREAPLWRQVALRTWRALKRGQASVMAAGVAFYAFLALVPALFALVSIYGLLADPHDVKGQVDALSGVLPQQVRAVLQAELARLAARSSRTMSFELAAGTAMALWAATKGTRALLVALAVVFQQAPDVVRLSATALAITAAGVGFGTVAVAAVVALPPLLGGRGLGPLDPAAGWLLSWLRWPVLGAVLALGLAFVYGRSRPGGWRGLTAGSMLATLLWLVGSGLFSWFVAHHSSYSHLDGSLAAFAVLLSWFLLSAYVVIFGAIVDAEVAGLRPDARPDAGAPRP
jgi:membrane protein